MLICHSCGTPVENRVKQCHHCHNFISSRAALCVAENTISQPLKIELESPSFILNQFTAKELFKSPPLINEIPQNNFSENGYSNSKNFGNGSSNNGHANNKQSEEKTVSINTESVPEPEIINNTVNYFLSLPNDKNLSESILHPNSEETANGAPSFNFKSSKENESTDFFAQLPTTTEENLKTNDELLTEVSFLKAVQQEKKLDEPERVSDPETLCPEETEKGLPRKEFLDLDKDSTHRRSFSGNFSEIASNKKSGNSTNTITNYDFASILNQIKSSFANISNSKTTTDKNKFFGLKPWQMTIALVLAVFLLYQGFQAFCSIGASLFGNTSNTIIGQGPRISGRWQFAAKWNNGSCNGQLVLHQNGNQIFGQGIDSRYGTYKFNGSRSGNHLDFLKQYYVNNAFIGHATEFHGDLDSNSNPLFISGNFSQEYMEGGKWRGKPVTIVGIWEAEIVQPLIEDDKTNNFVPLIQKHNEHPAASMGGFFGNLAKHGSWIAGAILAAGLLLYSLARQLLGPNGWIGIWDKQKYVPAQFMKEHKKEKALLSKPVTPGSLILGQRWEWKPWFKPFFWIPRYLALPADVRTNSPHVLILGGGEKGKSRLMAKMITHDIDSADRAIILVDSDGELADLLLRWIASHPNGPQIAQRLLVIDPTSNAPAPSFNPLEIPDDHDLQNAASSIVNGFKAIYHEPPGSQNQWSPQTAHILRNCAMLLMANSKTLLDLPTLLQDNDFRDILLEKIEQKQKERAEYSTLLETWGQYKRLARTEQWINWYEPILNRIGPTLINQRLRPILTQPKGEINLKNIIAEKKILIVKIPKGQLHDDANLLGSLIVTGAKQAAITLCTDNKLNDRTAALYLDEFDHFIEKETLDAITTETRKFQLGFIGATKTLQHLPEDWRNQIEANIGTMCVFALTKKDGDMLGPRMFRVSGRKAKHLTLMNIFNPINTSPQFDFISDEEKFNIDRILAQSERNFYAYRVGSEAGIFRMLSLDFDNIPDEKVDPQLIELMYKNR